MSFRASTAATASAFQAIKQQAAASKDYLIRQKAQMEITPCDSRIVLSVIAHFASVLTSFASWAATPGLAAYARDQENDQAYDIAAEYVAMRNAMISVRDNLMALFPKDGSGYLLYEQFDASGNRTARIFTAAQLAPAVALIDTVLTTIS